MWNAEVSLGVDCFHAGRKDVNRPMVGNGEAVLVERRATERGAERAKFRRASILNIFKRIGGMLGRKFIERSGEVGW